MSEVTNEAKAVAWVSARSLRLLARYREESMFVTSERSEFCTEPLYPAAEVERLEARIRELRDALTRIAWHSRDITGAPDMIAIASNALELDHRKQESDA